MGTRGALFREIHKNTWLKKASIEAKKLPAGNKKIEKFWVVFCVHDDCEALLEGYVEPRQAASHNPDWTISLQTVQHISHALVPNEQEYEFVIALNNDVARFLAPTWECMQEWVEALRSKLREMKILSPKENIYSKLPEIKPPLLPTRDPTSPLPAPPPVPAALVPGIERIVTTASSSSFTSTSSTIRNIAHTTITTDSISINTESAPTTSSVQANTLPSSTTSSTSSTQSYNIMTNNTPTTSTFSTAMSNTSSQNLMNLLTNPIPAYNYNNSLNDSIDSDLESTTSTNSLQFDNTIDNNASNKIEKSSMSTNCNENKLNHLSNAIINAPSTSKSVNLPTISLAKTFTDNVLSDPNTCPNQIKPIDTVTVDIQNSSPSSASASFVGDNDTGANVIDSTPASPGKLPIVIPRPHTSRTLSDPKLRKVPNQINNIQKTLANAASVINVPDTPTSTNITIIQVSTPIPNTTTSRPADVFNFEITDTNDSIDSNFKSNVQIIPSNDHTMPTLTLSSENNINNNNNNTSILALNNKSNDFHKITTNISTEENQIIQVKVPNSPSPGYGKIIPKSLNDAQKIVLTTNNSSLPSTSAITNISVNNTNSNHQSYYEQVFLMPSSSSTSIPEPGPSSDVNIVGSQVTQSVKSKLSLSLNNIKHQRSASHNELEINRLRLKNTKHSTSDSVNSNNINGNNKELRTNTIANDNVTTIPSSSENSASSNRSNHAKNTLLTNTSNENRTDLSKKNSLLMSARRAAFLTRGLTEAAITRPSRSDKNLASRTRSKPTTTHATEIDNNQTNSDNNNTTESQDQRKRSSSTSDAQSPRHRHANNSMNNDNRRIQSPPQPFRPAEPNQQSTGRLTLKEQQVVQLRREMMHPTGVRMKLRRKDCIGSIAIIDAFGAVWVAGWKQNDHPVLYNALHIGDQLISVGGVATSTASETHKLIRSSPGLLVELIVRRVPFGRVYAIRREMEGQCLGLIRDGNTATIVDVVPNSLAARHGLPPKTQSCDGLSLTFWVLTEINGRPLNLFFKENEIKDRLNAVGRDISILVQPSDLVMKLKKQLKSLRGYKDYIVQ